MIKSINNRFSYFLFQIFVKWEQIIVEIQTDGLTTQKRQILTSEKAMKLKVSQTSSVIEKKLVIGLIKHGKRILLLLHLSLPTGAALGKIHVMTPVLLMYPESYKQIIRHS